MFCVYACRVLSGAHNSRMEIAVSPLLPRAAAVLVGLCCMASCARAQEPGSAGFPALEDRRAAAFRVEALARSADETNFSEVTGLDVDSRGRIYVADWFSAQVTVLDSTGGVVRTLGRKGLGPGEFRAIRGLQVLPGDSLLVYDPSAGRLSVFAPDAAEPAYVLNLGAALNGPAPFVIYRAGDAGGFVALIRPPFVQGDTARRMDHVRALNADGSPRGGPLRSFASKSFLHVRQGSGFSVMPNPFGNEGLFAVAPEGALHLAWTDSLGVETVDLSGRRTGGFSVPYRAPGVTPADVDSALSGMPEPAVRMFRPALRDSLPERWPALRGLLCEIAGTVWLGLSAPAGAEAEWASFSPDGRYLGSVFLPRGVEVRAVRAGRVYSVQKNDDGIPSVVVFRIAAQAAGGSD